MLHPQRVSGNGLRWCVSLLVQAAVMCLWERRRNKASVQVSERERLQEILGVIYNVAAMLFPSPRVCGSSVVCVALRETPDKDRAGVAADDLAGEIHLVTQHVK